MHRQRGLDGCFGTMSETAPAGRGDPSYEAIAKKAAGAKSTVSAAIKVLEAMGIPLMGQPHRLRADARAGSSATGRPAGG
jgi:hypothetical protein